MHDAIQAPQRMRYSFESRCRAVQAMLSGTPVPVVARSQGVGRATAYRWWRRFRSDGWAGLVDRPCTPHRQPRRLAPELEARIVAARVASGDGPQALAAKLGLAASSVGKVLRRLGCSRLPREPRPPVVRYEREHPGELVHIDTQKLGRFWQVGKRILQDGVQRSPRAGWQHIHVAVDDHSRLAYVEVLPTERADDATAFLQRALAWYREQGEVAAAYGFGGDGGGSGSMISNRRSWFIRCLHARPRTGLPGARLRDVSRPEPRIESQTYRLVPSDPASSPSALFRKGLVQAGSMDVATRGSQCAMQDSQYGAFRPGNIGKCFRLRVQSSASRRSTVAAIT